MNKIEQMVKEMCPGGVRYCKLKEIGDFYSGLSGKTKDDFIGGNAKFISYTNIFKNPSLDISTSDKVKIVEGEKQNTIQYGDVLFTGSSETPDECGMSSVLDQLTDEKLYLNSFCFGYRFFDLSDKSPRFFKHLFRSDFVRTKIKKTANGVTRFNISKKLFGSIEIPLPPLPIQEAIVEILDKFESLQQGLQDELQARKKQYEYYRNKLLTQFPNNVEVKEYTLGEICEFVKDGTHSSFKDVEDGYPLLSAKDITNGAISITEKCRKISKKDFDSIYTRYKLAQGDVLVTIVGSIGRTAIIKDNVDIAFQRSVGILRPKSIVLSSYLYYSIQTSSVQNQLAAKTNKSAQGGVYLGELCKIRMVLPPIEKQKETVSILDKLETLVNDQEKGIPAEIAAVKKQYEYYRNKLLTFSTQNYKE